MWRFSHPSTITFLVILAVSLIIWILRGIGILVFIPGWIVMIFFLLSLVAGIVQGVLTWR